jgi:nucleoside-diphosphate-sugar epimerase
MELARQCGVKRFVHVSSTGIYGNLKNCPADEESYCKPQNIYGETKMAAEAEVRKIYEEKKFPIVILRPVWVYGPGCPRTLKIYNALSKGHFVMIGSGKNMRHPVYIKDMVSACILAIESESAVGETIIIGGDQPMTALELVESFCKALDLNKPKIRIPRHLAIILASGSEIVFKLVGKEPPISRRTLEFFQTNNAFSIINSKRILGFQPLFSFEEGLKDSKFWLESNAKRKL